MDENLEDKILLDFLSKKRENEERKKQEDKEKKN